MEDIESDVSKIINEQLKLPLKSLYIVSTYKNHPDLDEYCEELKERLELNFDIIYWGWNTIEEYILDNKRILKKYWPNFSYSEDTTEK